MIIVKEDGTKHVVKQFEDEQHLKIFTEGINRNFKEMCVMKNEIYEEIIFEVHKLTGFETPIYTISNELAQKIAKIGLCL